jgi:hypothetical protein
MPDTPIARRQFTINADPQHQLEVLVYAPIEDGPDYRCNYEIREADQLVRQSSAFGIDSLQTLVLAMQKLGADLAHSEYAKSGRLFWNDQSDDLGLLPPKT